MFYGGQPVLYIYTFRDQLHLMHSFNEAFENPTSVQEFYARVRKVLDEELVLS